MLDLSLLTRAVWINKKVIIKSVAYGIILGLIIAFGSKVEFNSSLKSIPSSNEGIKSNMGGLSSLAGLAGISLSPSSNNAINPEIYPQITSSIPFLIEVLNTEVYFATEDTTISSFNYFKNIYRPSFLQYVKRFTIGLPFTVKRWLAPDKDSETLSVNNHEIIKLSREDTKLIEQFKERIISSYDSETGILSIAVIMTDPYAAAEIAELTFRLLQKYLIEFKSEKAKEELAFIDARFQESKNRYEALQREMATYTDKNQNVRSARVQIEQQNIKNEYDLAYDIYKGLANQLEQAKIKVKEDSPVLSLLDPAKIPVEKSSPKRLLILIIFTFLGFMYGLSRIVFDDQINGFIRSLKGSSTEVEA
jgi:uncharacterized protein involved in exopolysaccharide biosynthesis